MRKFFFICLLWTLSLLTSSALAVPITFIQQGTGSGSIGDTYFDNADFTISAIADTENRSSYRSGYFIDNLSASINISGLGDFSFLTDTRFFVNNMGGTVGFSRAGTGGLDLFSGPFDSSFASWDMLSGIGLVAGRGNLIQWSHSAVITDAGLLTLAGGPSYSVFQADMGAAPVPEPATIALLSIGLAGAGFLRWRNKV